MGAEDIPEAYDRFALTVCIRIYTTDALRSGYFHYLYTLVSKK